MASSNPDPDIPSAPPKYNEETVAIEVDKEAEAKANYNTMSNADSITASDIEKLRCIQQKYEKVKYLRQAYTIVVMQLLNVSGFVFLFLCNDDIHKWTREHQYIILTFGLIAIVTYSLHSCCKHYDFTCLNFLGFVLYTISEGLFIGSLTTLFDEDVLLFSTGITILLCIALTLFAFKTESTDFSAYTKCLLSTFVGLLLLGCVGLILHSYLFLLIVCLLADVFLSVKFVQNTMIVRDTTDISASIIIFISIINLFIFVSTTLQLVDMIW